MSVTPSLQHLVFPTQDRWPEGYYTLIQSNFPNGLHDFHCADGLVRTYADENNVLRNVNTPPRPVGLRQVFRLAVIPLPGDEAVFWYDGYIVSAAFVGYQPVSSLRPELHGVGGELLN